MDKGKTKRLTKKITVFGIVQGVGFRPLVYHLAEKFHIKGSVKNKGGLVEILVQASDSNYKAFLDELEKNNGQGYEIHHMACEDLEEEEYENFHIEKSGQSKEVALIPPDLPLCQDCMEELYKEDDRRFKNPFISCMSCGARYTIIEDLPYDRENTSMKDFAMCPACHKEYTDKESRRFHAQTISCYDCGPYLIFKEKESKECFDKEAFDKALLILKSGGILAVKGIGGYHFVCSPFLEDSVLNLRKLKGREEKPFAVMFHDIESMKEYCHVCPEEEKLLKSMARPIVLLYVKSEEAKKEKTAPSVIKDSNYCGAFLPYTPLQELLTKALGPLIMTSANFSGCPIIKEDETMLSLSSPYLKGVLYNTRRIIRSVDDSVAMVVDNNAQVIRRSRGYVPYPYLLEPNERKEEILALGGDLKAAFCLYKEGNAFVSQYFGDLEERTIYEEYVRSIRDLSTLLKIKPSLLVCDMHPGYHGTSYGESLNLPIYKVQHHHAHVGSVMAEHKLKGPVIGVAFDGTGYGTDGNVWGGEFLICEGDKFNRAAHLRYVNMLGGDASMKDGKKTASCYLIQMGLKEYAKDDRLSIIEAAIKGNYNTVLTSSMGRLFDAVAAILEIQEMNEYEGQCAAGLEKAAAFARNQGKCPVKMEFGINEKENYLEIDMEPVLRKLSEEKERADKEALALGFHYAISDMITALCEKIYTLKGIKDVALCGGVFQNKILMEHTLELLRERAFRVYYNRTVPPNDGSISLGQAYLALLRG